MPNFSDYLNKGTFPLASWQIFRNVSYYQRGAKKIDLGGYDYSLQPMQDMH